MARGSRDSDTSENTISTSSDDDNGSLRVLGYLRAIMTNREDLRKRLNIELDEAKAEDRVYPKLRQLQDDLTPDETSFDRGAWFTEITHLHVHFGTKNEQISLAMAKNVCVLYGISETEIQSWLPMSQRNSSWCFGLRHRMEKEMLACNADRTDVELLPGRRYTPSAFMDNIYEANNLEELRTKISGWSAGEWISTKIKDQPCRRIQGTVKAREWITDALGYVWLAAMRRRVYETLLRQIAVRDPNFQLQPQELNFAPTAVEDADAKYQVIEEVHRGAMDAVGAQARAAAAQS
ncbi:uncharacterized protein PAC_06767 [Phialocephala subalpina]|uniref:Uncharacterized protein n=1 Tax=Phialocephala subalpina TaxID=576137 RepID=A0A1L7WVU1_9HELO|nr:uncharacterized protein PAC_06767 [Phialocephala subalpina]